jgi:manganese transport protein
VGTALALQLLFGLPLPVGVLVTAFDTLVLLGLQRFGIRRLEALVISLVALVGACFAVEMLLLRPDVASVLGGPLWCIPGAGAPVRRCTSGPSASPLSMR